MEDGRRLWGLLFAKMINGCAYHKIITDNKGKPIDFLYLDMNQAFAEIAKCKREDLIGKCAGEVFPNFLLDKIPWVEFYGDVALKEKSFSAQQYVEELDKWYLVNAFSPEKGYFITIYFDITDSVKQNEYYKSSLEKQNEELSALYEEIYASEEELHSQYDELNRQKNLLVQSEAKFKTLVNNTLDLIFSVDCDLTFDEVNDSFCKSLNLRREDIIGKQIFDVIDINDVIYRRWNSTIVRVLQTKTSQSFENFCIKNGNTIYYSNTFSPVFDKYNQIIGITGTSHNITPLKLNQKKIKHLAYHDLLTDLPNRLVFIQRLNNAIKSARHRNAKVAVLFFDMDNFKRINDIYGHEFGDKLLHEVSLRIVSCVQPYDTVSRMNGDEFAVMLRNLKSDRDSRFFLHKLLDQIRRPFVIDGSTVDVTSTIGVSMYPEDGKTAEELLRNAATAMHKAKKKGKNTYLFFNDEIRSELAHKNQIEQSLKKALKNQEFVLYYQPIFMEGGRKLRGYESLIRWISPDQGLINPVDFIQIAEENGIINQIGEWVIWEACNMIKKMNTTYNTELIFSVNISAVQLRQKNFAQNVLKYIEEIHIKPEWLELEVTENIFIDNMDLALYSLNKLREAGVQIALDDFGTGYSSLSYLKELPINIVKIDKSFTDAIDINNTKRDLTRPIISLAHRVGYEVIAEGVETRTQLDYLIEAKCDHFQGFYLGRPMPSDEAFIFPLTYPNLILK